MFFADLWLLWVLVPAYVLWLLSWAALRLLEQQPAREQQSRAAVLFSRIRNLQRLKPSTTVRLRRVVQALRALTILLLVVAMLRPQTGRKHTEINTQGIDIVLAIDTSGSMRALDLDSDRSISSRRNRLEVVKSVVDRFVRKRENDQIGMVVFGGEAFTQCPLTLDHGIVTTFLDQVEIGMAGDMTAIGSALGTAVKRLKDSEAKSKVIVLLTDGRSNAGVLSPKKAAEVAQALGVKVYTIGAGTRGKAPFLVDTLFGKQVAYEDVQIDEAGLREVAEITGGEYFRAEDEDALTKIYDQIDALEKTEVTMKSYMEYNERFPWFVMPAIGLMLMEVLLLGTRLRKLP